jgi:hypothetical protein
VTMYIEPATREADRSAQPETVAKLLREMGLRNASALQQADALQAWVRDNVPNPALRISIRRNGYGSVLGRSLGLPPREVPTGRARHTLSDSLVRPGPHARICATVQS